MLTEKMVAILNVNELYAHFYTVSRNKYSFFKLKKQTENIRFPKLKIRVTTAPRCQTRKRLVLQTSRSPTLTAKTPYMKRKKGVEIGDGSLIKG